MGLRNKENICASLIPLPSCFPTLHHHHNRLSIPPLTTTTHSLSHFHPSLPLYTQISTSSSPPFTLTLPPLTLTFDIHPNYPTFSPHGNPLSLKLSLFSPPRPMLYTRFGIALSLSLSPHIRSLLFSPPFPFTYPDANYHLIPSPLPPSSSLPSPLPVPFYLPCTPPSRPPSFLSPCHLHLPLHVPSVADVHIRGQSILCIDSQRDTLVCLIHPLNPQTASTPPLRSPIHLFLNSVSNVLPILQFLPYIFIPTSLPLSLHQTTPSPFSLILSSLPPYPPLLLILMVEDTHDVRVSTLMPLTCLISRDLFTHLNC